MFLNQRWTMSLKTCSLGNSSDSKQNEIFFIDGFMHSSDEFRWLHISSYDGLSSHSSSNIGVPGRLYAPELQATCVVWCLNTLLHVFLRSSEQFFIQFHFCIFMSLDYVIFNWIIGGLAISKATKISTPFCSQRSAMSSTHWDNHSLFSSSVATSSFFQWGNPLSWSAKFSKR